MRLAAVAQARVDARQVDRHEANVPPCSVAPPLAYARSCLLGAALLLAGCGVGQTGHQAPVTVTITRDLGAVTVREVQAKSGVKVGALLRGQPSGQRWVNGVAAGDDATVHGGDRVWADTAAASAATPAVRPHASISPSSRTSTPTTCDPWTTTACSRSSRKRCRIFRKAKPLPSG